MSLEQFFTWWETAASGEIFSRSLVQRYRASLDGQWLAPRTINLRLAPVRKSAEEAAAEQLLPHATVAEIRSVQGACLGGADGQLVDQGASRCKPNSYWVFRRRRP